MRFLLPVVLLGCSRAIGWPHGELQEICRRDKLCVKIIDPAFPSVFILANSSSLSEHNTIKMVPFGFANICFINPFVSLYKLLTEKL